MNNYFFPMVLTTSKRKLIIIVMTCFTLTSCAYVEKFRSGIEQGAAVARNVKSELIKSPAVEAAPLQVRVENKTILLEGFVESLDEKQEAEIVARELYPAFDVLNNITVR